MNTTSSPGRGLRATILILIFSTAASAIADIPGEINYQGYLTDSAGAAIDGSVQVQFSIYTVPEAGIPEWTANQTVEVSQGLFSVNLGGDTPFPSAMFDVPLWLGITVESDPELLPRGALTSVAYAFRAEDASTLQGLTPASLDQSAAVATLQAQLASLASHVAFLASKVSTTVFVTSVSFPAGFGSLAGADAQCQSLADAAGLTGTYLAWLSDDSGSPSSRFVQSPSAYKMVDGTVVANSWADLTDGVLITRINRDENGTARNSRVFTGTATDGTSDGVDCANWTDETSNGRVKVGSTFEGLGVNEAWWSTRGNVGCQDNYRLYCFEQ